MTSKLFTRGNLKKKYKYLVVANVLGDPRHEMSDSGVDSRILSFAATNSPGHHSCLNPFAFVDHQWATGIALDGIRENGIKILTAQFKCDSWAANFQFMGKKFRIWFIVFKKGKILLGTYTAWIPIGSSCTQHRLNNSSRSSSSVFCRTLLITPELYRYFL